MAVSLAILLQVLVSAPLLLRMAGGDGAVWLDGVPTCHAQGGTQRPGDPALPSHDHAHCVLCQGNLLAAAPPPVLLPSHGVARLRLATRARGAARPRERRRFEGYASRAPPGFGPSPASFSRSPSQSVAPEPSCPASPHSSPPCRCCCARRAPLSPMRI
jgi:hypothetical protein